MIEVILLDYLSTALNVPCYMEEPADPEESYIIIEKTAGRNDEHISRATFAIQSYGASLYDAASLNLEVKIAMASINLPEIARAALNSDYNFTDTTTRRYRYQAVYDIVYYEEDF